ncbi:hypothetical protein O7635_15565 [Asanoa sp. WMMD1127]|uniref:hypothetical protein n=1 Tax=Asanoa sp. WMMD1127 TaxID=3016107 RepID=UPI002417104B|nr:hypothetical protein [Asanoa sp. WMMD1127]MDG4823274.1 hypothetical protein [Asanoa sp. WMMD1127]
MLRHGYSLYAFRVHSHGGSPAPLGKFDGEQDALPLLYGILRGLSTHPVTDKQRHLRLKQVTPAGRSVRFSIYVGASGQTSEFYHQDDEETVLFVRDDHHIEHTTLRCLVLAPTQSTTGLLVLEVQGRAGAKSLLAPALSRRFKEFSGNYILDVAAVVDEAGLARLLEEANAHQITLRRHGLPADIADAVDLSDEDAETGRLELKITPGKVKQFQRRLIAKLRGDDSSARMRLLHLSGIEFDELNVAMTVGQRSTTLSITSDRVPSFVYDLPGHLRPDDETFYKEVHANVEEVSRAVGMTVVPG